MQVKKFENHGFTLNVYGTSEIPYFKGAEVAKILGYKNTKDALIHHVDSEDKISFEKLNGNVRVGKHDPYYLHPQTIFINESGLYSLILSSKLPGAKEFKRWVTSEVLPSIRKTGEYNINKNVKTKLTWNLQTEADLHKLVVNHLRSKYPEVMFTASLGELQDTPEKRLNCYEMGYLRGTPDLFIFHRNRLYAGLAIEFKTPKGTGILSEDQEKCLKRLKDQKWDVLVSNDFSEIILRIYEHIKLNKMPKKRSKKTVAIKVQVKDILDYLAPKDNQL